MLTPKGTPARPIHRPDPLCPICGDHPLDCESIMQLVRLVHGLQLQEAGILVTAQDAAPGARDGGEDPGDGYLLTGAATLRTNIAIAIRRLLNALRAHQFPFGERLVVVIAPESEAQDALQEALDIRRTA